MKKFAFVILHYNSTKDTLECVESIEKMCFNSDFNIYIVDNASPNNSGETLKKWYLECSKITVILSPQNLGFARGNNLGIDAARKTGYSDFIIVMNNDTKLIQNNFCELINCLFEKSGFAALGPTIYTPNGKTSINPGRNYILSGTELDLTELMYRGSLFFLKLHLNVFSDFYRRICLRILRIKGSRIKITNFQYCENHLLHGCCIVFSSLFFEKLSGFDSRTFLYFEEEILFAQIRNAGLKTVYSSEIGIFHKEDGATDSIIKQARAKERFIFTNILKSIAVYRKILKENTLIINKKSIQRRPCL